jgi:hypothetical protein
MNAWLSVCFFTAERWQTPVNMATNTNKNKYNNINASASSVYDNCIGFTKYG